MTSTNPFIAALVSHDPTVAPMWLTWRVGRKVGRTIYAQAGNVPSDEDVLIGMMDTAILAREVVDAHNYVLQKIQIPKPSQPEDRTPKTETDELREALRWVADRYGKTLAGQSVRDADECLEHTRIVLEKTRKDSE